MYCRSKLLAASKTAAAVAVCASNHWEKATCAESGRVWSAVKFSQHKLNVT